MRTKIKLFCGIFLLSLAGNTVLAQDWKVEINNPVKWMSVSQTGVLLVMTDQALFGVDPISNKVAWENASISNVKEDGVEHLSTAPLALLKTFSGNTWLINTYTGKMLFDSEAFGFKSVNQRYLCLDEGILLIDGNDAKERKLVAVDYDKEEKIKWELPLGKRKNQFAAGAYRPGPIERDNLVYFPIDETLFKLIKNDGSVLWQKAYDKNIALMFEKNDRLFIVEGPSTEAFKDANIEKDEMSMTSSSSFGKFNIHCIGISDAKEVWKSLSFKGSFAGMRIIDDCAFIFNDGGTTDRVNLETGVAVWAKPPRTRTSLVNSVTVAEQGYVMNTLLDQTYSIEHIDFNGAYLARNINRSSAPTSVIKNTANGVFIIGSDRFDLLKGPKLESSWGKEIKSSPIGSYIVDENGNYYVVTTSGAAYHINLQQGSYSQLCGNLPISGDEVQGLELYDDGLLISLPQGLVKIDKKGGMLWNKSYPAIELSGGMKFLLSATSEIASLYSDLYAVDSKIYGMAGDYTGNEKYTKMSKSLQKKASASSLVASGAYSLINTRFQANQDSERKALILTKNPETQSASFVVVDKTTGEEQYIDVDSKNPMFTFDHVDQMLYVVKENKAIEAYQIR